MELKYVQRRQERPICRDAISSRILQSVQTQKYGLGNTNTCNAKKTLGIHKHRKKERGIVERLHYSSGGGA